MKIFEDIEMEFFDASDACIEDPKNGEEVLVILKEGAHTYHHPSGLIQCTFRKYTSVPVKFERYDHGGPNEKYVKGQIKCWGRLKTK